MSQIVGCAIHPAIGIARVGNSPTAFFVGPQIPGAPNVPPGGFKDAGEPSRGIPPRVKRQAAEFRIYGLEASGKVVRELTAKEASITWSVHLVNRKAEWDRFEGTLGEELSPFDDERRAREHWRNASVEDRRSLIIDPGVRILSRPGERVAFDGGRFRGIDVPLGEASVTREGRLRVLGGSGRSGRSNQDARIKSYANNDQWFDDVSDGYVRATVVLGGTKLEALQAWVIVAPPDFAPVVQNVVTLWDVAYDVAVRLMKKVPLPTEPSFTNDIYPILQRLDQLRWVRRRGAPDLALGDLSVLSARSKAAEPFRQSVFQRLRDPNLPATNPEAAKAQASADFLPALSGDAGDAAVGSPAHWLFLTHTQYELMKRWAAGTFAADWSGAPPAPARDMTPDGLDRAALEACSGGAFYPGIEAGWVMRNPVSYSAPFRLSERFRPGDLTKRMACPWQADFYECRETWWPAQRPDDVLLQHDYERIHEIDDELSSLRDDDPRRPALLSERTRLVDTRRSWSRGLPTQSPEGDNAMVDAWPQHGFVVDRTTDSAFHLDGASAVVERERGPYDGLSWGQYFHLLMNIEGHPEFRAKARELALRFLEGADFGADVLYNEFPYSEEAFLERIAKIYDGLEAGMFVDSRMDTGVIALPVVIGYDGDHPLKKLKQFEVGAFSNRAVRERIKQRAPFNLVDGAWLRQIQAVGIADRVQAALFEIWEDETGNGTPEKNHSNVYDVLLRSLGIYLPAVTSLQFLEEGLLDSAFIQPVLQLTVSLFPDEFLPELLGMTLYVEWESTPSMIPAVRHISGRGYDPHFYSLHVAIDNVTTGHAAKARDAIREYLATAAQRGEDVQALWARIWRGYVTWATAGDLGRELLEAQMAMDGKRVDLAYPFMLTSETVDLDAIGRRLMRPDNDVSRFVVTNLNADTAAAIAGRDPSKPLSQGTGQLILRDLNLLIQGPSVYDEQRFRGVTLAADTRVLLEGDVQDEDLVKLNRLLLRDAFGPAITDVPKLKPQWFPDLEKFHRDRVVEIIRRKAEVAKPLHAAKGLAELFDKPDELLSTLVARGFFNPERPRSSRFMELLEFKGPMYKVFSNAEVETIYDWIESMRGSSESAPPPSDDPQTAARQLLSWLRGNAAIAKKVLLHANYSLRDKAGNERSVFDWFDDPVGLMEALVREQWVVPRRPTDSIFYGYFSTGRMSTLGSQVTEMVGRWIRTGAEVPRIDNEQPTNAPFEAVSELPTVPNEMSMNRLAAAATLDAISPRVALRANDAEIAVPVASPPRPAPSRPADGARLAEAARLANAFFHRRKLIGMGAVH